jgi:hypothetical protein
MPESGFGLNVRADPAELPQSLATICGLRHEATVCSQNSVVPSKGEHRIKQPIRGVYGDGLRGDLYNTRRRNETSFSSDNEGILCVGLEETALADACGGPKPAYTRSRVRVRRTLT